MWNIAWAWGKFRGQSPLDFPRAQAIFHSISWIKSQYRHSHLPNDEHAAAVVYNVVTAVAANVDAAVAVDLIASVERVISAMLTHRHSNSSSHSN